MFMYNNMCMYVSRLRLVPGFLSQVEADWMFSKLLAELPWSQKTNFKQGVWLTFPFFSFVRDFAKCSAAFALIWNVA